MSVDTQPSAPSGLVATPGSGCVSLAWSDNGEPDVVGYKVYRSTTSGTGYASIAGGVADSAYADTAVATGTPYYYVVTAVDGGAQESTYSNEASAMPTGPLLVNGGFEDNGGDDSTIYAGWAMLPLSIPPLPANAVGTKPTCVEQTGQTFFPMGAQEGSFFVRTWSQTTGGNESIAGLYQSFATAGGSTYDWSIRVAACDSQSTSFIIEVRDGGVTGAVLDTFTGSTAANLTPAGAWHEITGSFTAASGTAVFLFYQYNNSDGDLAFDNAVITGGGGDTTAPAAPTGLGATPGDGQVVLDWDDNAEPDLASYNVYRSTTSGSGYAQIATGEGSSQYTDNTADNGTTYYYVVTAVDNSAYESGYSNEASATPSATPVAPPDPTLAISDQTSGSATHTDSTTVNVAIDNDETAVAWIVSATHSSQPEAGDTAWSAVEPTTFALSGGEGTHTVYVWVKNASGLLNTGPVSAEIELDTTAPTFSSVSATPDPAGAGDTLTITFTASETLVANPTVTVGGNAAAFASLSVLDYTYTYDLTGADAPGAAAIEVSGDDPAGNPGSGSGSVTIVGNTAPTVGDIPDQSDAEGATFATIALDGFVTDDATADADIAWIWTGNTDLSVSVDGSQVATVSAPSADWHGSETLTFTATDGGGLTDSDSATFTLTPVNDPPVVSAIPGQTTVPGGAFEEIVLDDWVADVDNADSDIVWTVSGETNLVVTIDGARVATVAVATPEWLGTETITFTATDPSLAGDSVTVAFTVEAADGLFGGGCTPGGGGGAAGAPLVMALLGLALARRRR